MKLKALLMSVLMGLGLTACSEESKDFSGSYRIESMTIKVSKMPSGKYEVVFIDRVFKDEKTTISEVRDGNRLYETNGHYLGEFTDAGIKMAGGAFYRKVLAE